MVRYLFSEQSFTNAGRVEIVIFATPPSIMSALIFIGVGVGPIRHLHKKVMFAWSHTNTSEQLLLFIIFAVLLCCSSLFSALLFVFSHFRNSKSKKKKYPHLIIPNLLVCMYTPEQTRLFSILDEWTTTTATTISTDKWWRFSKTELCKIPFKIYNILVPLKDDDIIYACA